MLVFKGSEEYSSFVRIIKDALLSNETYEARKKFPNVRGALYLSELSDEQIQKEAMDVLTKIDEAMDTKSAKNDNLINNKLSFFLEAGIAFGEHYDMFSSVNASSKAEMILSCPILWADKEDAAKYLPLFCDDKFILLLKQKYFGDIPEIMLAMKERYDSLSFPTTDRAKVLAFRKSEIAKLEADKEKFLSDVPSYSDIAIEVDTNLRKAGF